MMNHTYEQEVREAEQAICGAGPGPNDTNEDVIDAEDAANFRAAISVELRECVMLHLYPSENEVSPLSLYSPLMNEVAEALCPLINRVVQLREIADDLQDDLTEVTQDAIGFIVAHQQ